MKGNTALHEPERLVLRGLLAVLTVFAYWTVAHQIATFSGMSWASLQQLTSWLLVPFVALGFWWAGRVAESYSKALQVHSRLRSIDAPDLGPMLWMPFVVLGIGWISPSYPLRFAVVLGCAALWLAFVWRRTTTSGVTESTSFAKPCDDAAAAWTWLWLGIFAMMAAGLVLFVNRSDFDDAEYLQLALQTLRHPDKPLYSFDASLGTLIEQFRFAPYRTTSYESFVALVSSLSGLSLLDTYYLVLPSVWAVLSVLIAFTFLRWFLPRPWALLALGIFLLIAVAWGEIHVAYGNRMYVRLFQGKGLLVALTTPLTVLMALLWMQRPRLNTWAALLMVQMLAVGVSSSGLVVTLFATALGLVAGWLSKPSADSLYRAAIGGSVLLYPIALGLWLKYASNAAGKVEDIGTYLPIEASLGGNFRQMIVLGVTAIVLMLMARLLVQQCKEGANASSCGHSNMASLGWLLALSFLLILNPFLIGYITEATSRNMNWRLAWATPMPLLMAASLTWLIWWAASLQNPLPRSAASLLTLGAVVGFATGDPPALRHSNNNLTWGFWQHKLPPEYADAVALTKQIREQPGLTPPITVLVEPRVGTWLTVVAPDLQLVMPGHGYGVTLQTILPSQEFAERNRLIANSSAWISGDPAIKALAQRYGVTVVAKKINGKSWGEAGGFELHLGDE